MALADKFRLPAFLFGRAGESQACTGSYGVDYLAAPWPRSIRKHHCVSSLCGVARQAGSWHGLQTSTVSFLWSAWMVHWWKMEITSGPTVLVRFCSWEPHLLKMCFLCLVAQTDFCANFYANLGKCICILSGYKATWSFQALFYSHSLAQWLRRGKELGTYTYAFAVFFDQIHLKDILKWNICIPLLPSYNSQSHIVLTLVTFYVSVTGLSLLLASLLWENAPMNEHSS